MKDADKGLIDDHDRCESVNVSSGTGSPGFVPDKIQRAIKRLCLCMPVIPFIFLLLHYSEKLSLYKLLLWLHSGKHKATVYSVSVSPIFFQILNCSSILFGGQ